MVWTPRTLYQKWFVIPQRNFGLMCQTPRLQECVLGKLKTKTVILVTHQVDFLHQAHHVLVWIDKRLRSTLNSVMHLVLGS